MLYPNETKITLHINDSHVSTAKITVTEQASPILCLLWTSNATWISI